MDRPARQASWSARRTSGSFRSAPASWTLGFQNEHLLATRDGETVATTPDLICVLNTDTGDPVTTEGLRYGLRVSVLAAPCDPRWTTPGGLALAGPRYFGYDVDYLPFRQA